MSQIVYTFSRRCLLLLLIYITAISTSKGQQPMPNTDVELIGPSTIIAGCSQSTYQYSIDMTPVYEYYDNTGISYDTHWYWTSTPQATRNNIRVIAGMGNAYQVNGSYVSQGDSYVTLTPLTTFTDNSLVGYYEITDQTGAVLTTGYARQTISAIAAPVLGTISANTSVCPNSEFELKYVGSQGVATVEWYVEDMGAWVNIGSSVQTAQFALTYSAQTTARYKAEPIACTGTLMPAYITINVTANGAGQIYGAREVPANNNEGVVTLADYLGSIVKWQYSENNGASWIDIAKTTEELTYEGLERSTLFRAQVQQCGNLAYSGTCTITVEGLHWIEQKSFGEDGGPVVTASTRTYYDGLGKTLQTQSLNIDRRNVLASQPLYNQYGQVVGNTLAAPINTPNFEYKPGFVSPAAAPTEAYDYTRFSIVAKRNAPEAVATVTPGTLGWYYSTNNTMEPYTAATSYPYTRTDAELDGSTGVVRSNVAGDAFKLGLEGRESVSGTFSLRAELDKYLLLKNKYYSNAEVGTQVTSLASSGSQQVVRNANGQQAITLLDREGHALMAMRPGNWLSVTNTLEIGWPYKFEKSAGQVYEHPVIDAVSNIMVQASSGAWVYIGPARGFVAFNTATNDENFPTPDAGYIFYCADPFTITTGRVLLNGTPISSNSAYVFTPQQRQASPYHNFYTLAPNQVTITPLLSNTTYKLLNTVTGNEITSTTSIPAGFYQLRILQGAVQLDYTNGYEDISFNFYNQKGQLLGSLAPNGTQAVLADLDGIPPGNYSTRSSLPFFTSYEYDQQGRLLALNETDAGRTEYIYRADGKPRFSQNAKQRPLGYFSYSNYDAIGRMIESGECAPSPGNESYFASIKSDASVLESTAQYGGFATYKRQDVMQTTYDIPNTQHGKNNYTQTFLYSNVSTTAKYSVLQPYAFSTLVSQTWYSYDDQGRVQWQIQQTAGQPSRTIDYIYDFDGKTQSVCYQKEVPAERLSHYYSYDDDRQLRTVETGFDDPASPVLPHTRQVRYEYYLHGPLKRTVYGQNLQGVDYTYTAQGWLKSINDADLNHDPGRDGQANSLLPDLFGASLHYFTNDYASAAVPTLTAYINGFQPRYDGTVYANAWQTPGSPKHGYGYRYDVKGQLQAAEYGTLNNFTARQYLFSAMGGRYNEDNLTYDPNGNLSHLRRLDGAGMSLMDINYAYPKNSRNEIVSNRLEAVTNGNNAQVIGYTYNAIGQVTVQQEPLEPNKTKYLEYDVSGKVTAIFQDAAKTRLVARYTYDEYGRRLIDQVSESPGSNVFVTTYHVRDAAGNELASYCSVPRAGTVALYEQPIYGSSRIGIYRRQREQEPAEQLYELNDQLGNTRVVFRSPQKQSYRLTMEDDNYSEERDNFPDPHPEKYDEVRSADYAHRNSPYGKSDYSMRLEESMGPSKTLHVQRGDKVHLEVYAAYPDTGGDIFGRASLLGLVTPSLQPATTTPRDQKPSANSSALQKALSRVSLGISVPLGAGIASTYQRTTSLPNAVLQYVLRKESDGSFIRNGTVKVSTDAEGNWELLSLDVDITESEPSTLEVIVEHYSGQATYFDDLLVEHTVGPVVAENHFYAYGQLNQGLSWKRSDRRHYGHGYQGQYATSDEESGYDGFELRMYDARIGRWLAADPKRQFFSAYIGMGNNPVNQVDVDGGDSKDWYGKGNGIFFDPNVKNQGDVNRLHAGGNYIGSTVSAWLSSGIFFRGYADGTNMSYLPDVVVDVNASRNAGLRNMIDFSNAGSRLTAGVSMSVMSAGAGSTLQGSTYATIGIKGSASLIGQYAGAGFDHTQLDFADALLDGTIGNPFLNGAADGFIDFKPFAVVQLSVALPVLGNKSLTSAGVETLFYSAASAISGRIFRGAIPSPGKYTIMSSTSTVGNAYANYVNTGITTSKK